MPESMKKKAELVEQRKAKRAEQLSFRRKVGVL